MKTFKQWVDGLGEAARDYIEKRCSDWADFTTEDYYRKIDPNDTEFLRKLIREAYGYNKADKLLLATSMLLLQKTDPDSKEMFNTLLQNNSDYDNTLCAVIGRDAYREWYRKKYGQRLSKSIDYILLMTDDFDNIDFSEYDNGNLTADPEYFDIFGEEYMLNFLKENPRLFKPTQLAIDDERFDKLFFGENGWTEAQKKQVIGNYTGDVWQMDDFLERIVAVDKSYLKYVYNIIYRDAAAAAKLYTAKKDNYDVNTTTVQQRFRYSKELRKLFMIAGCCARESLPKTKAGTIGDISALVKLYDFDFNSIFDCLYPELMEQQVVIE